MYKFCLIISWPGINWNEMNVSYCSQLQVQVAPILCNCAFRLGCWPRYRIWGESGYSPVISGEEWKYFREEKLDISGWTDLKSKQVTIFRVNKHIIDNEFWETDFEVWMPLRHWGFLNPSKRMKTEQIELEWRISIGHIRQHTGNVTNKEDICGICVKSLYSLLFVAFQMDGSKRMFKTVNWERMDHRIMNWTWIR